MDESSEALATAPNGVRWRRKPDGTTTPAELLAVLNVLGMDHAIRDWNLWEPGRRKAEEDRRHAVLEEWDHAEPPPGGYKYETAEEWEAEWDAQEAERKRQRAARAEAYDEGLDRARIHMLQEQANAGFMQHVLASHANGRQRAKAEELLAAAEQKAAALASSVGDPDAITDKYGNLPPECRSMNFTSLFDWRHRRLRALATSDRRGFQALLAMPAPDKASMCSECQAPADWHTYDISLCLYRGDPPPGSTAERIARAIPGWWGRCSADTTYRLCHWWGMEKDVLPDFDGDQWVAMLPPLLRVLFVADAPVTRKPRAKPDPRRALQRRLRKAEREAADLRKQLSALDPDEQS
jgi:hypothetical protein